MKEDKAGESQRWNQRSKGQRSRHLHKEVKEIGAFEIIPNLEIGDEKAELLEVRSGKKYGKWNLEKGRERIA